MAFTKGTWDVFRPLLQALHENSHFRLVDQGEFITIVELYGDDTFIHRINPETGDLETMNNRFNWTWENNLWLQAPIKIIKAWSFTYKTSGIETIYDNRKDALQCLGNVGDMMFEGYSTDHPLPNTGKFYLQKNELIEDILNEEFMTEDLITDNTEVN
jgi:hypothetical protein